MNKQNLNAGSINKKSTGLDKPDSMALKGLAILMMIFFHCFANEKTLLKYDVNFFPFTQDFICTVRLYLKICVCIYAFISGYGLYQSFRKTDDGTSRTTVKWEISRIIKTLSGFWFIFLVTLIINQFFLHLPKGLYFKEGTVRGIMNLFLDGMGFSALFGTPTVTVVWWYMGAAVIYIILLPMIYRVSEKYGYFTTAAFIILFPRVMNIGWTGSRNPYSFLLIFVTGMFFSRYDLFTKLDKIHLLKDKNSSADKILQFVLLLTALLASVVIFLRLPWSVIWEFQFVVCPVIFICFSKRWLITIPGIRQILIYLGKHSMNMYLLHALIKNRYCTDFVYSFKYFWLIPIVLTVMSLISSILIEQMKKLLRYEKGIHKLSDRLCRLVDTITTE